MNNYGLYGDLICKNPRANVVLRESPEKDRDEHLYEDEHLYYSIHRASYCGSSIILLLPIIMALMTFLRIWISR